MTEPEPSEPQSDLPEGIPAPPPLIPKPDLKDFREVGSTYGAKEDEPKRKKKKERGRNHPTDAYAPLPKSRGCGPVAGCLGLLAAVVVLGLVGGIGFGLWFGSGRFVSKGYTAVNLEEGSAVVTVAPEVPTCYVAKGTLHYNVPVTKVQVAFLAREVKIEGDFHEEVSITAVKVLAADKARFARNLEVHAAEFTDLGLTLKGDLTGRVIKNLP